MNQYLLPRFDRIIYLLIFAVAIYAPFLIGLIAKDDTISHVEKRKLNSLPPFPESIEEFEAYPEAFNLYYSDHFGLREFFTDAYFDLMNKFSSKSSTEHITKGKDGWLFLGSVKPGYERFGDPIGDAIHINLFTLEELKAFAKVMTTIKNWLDLKGIEYVYVIVPNKHTIYFDKLPDYLSKQNKESATDQIVAYLRQNTDIPVVDLRQVLWAEKKKHQVYYKYDTHWNHFGANAAQFELMQRISTFFPEQIFPKRLSMGQFKILTRTVGDLSQFTKLGSIREIGPQPIFKGGCPWKKVPPNAKERDVHKIYCKTQGLSALVFRDSFFTTLQPYLARHFKRSTYIWERLSFASLKEYVKKEKPDIVIDQITERTLPYVPSNGVTEIDNK